MRILVTGGAGFIGSNLVRHLESQGLGVIVLDDLSTGNLANLAETRAEIVRGSILDLDALDACASAVDVIVHLAARPSVPRSLVDPLASHEINATGTLQVLEAARRYDASFIMSSSSSVYGANPELPKREVTLPMPISPYAASKLAAESYAFAYRECFGVRTMVFRFFNVYGPGQPSGHAYAAVIPALISAALERRPLPIHGDGQQTRDFTYVGTVTEVLTLAVQRSVSEPQPVNLAFGTRSSLIDVVGELERALGRELSLQHSNTRPGDVHDSQSDTTRLKALFPEVVPVSLSTGLSETIRWHRLRPEAPSLELDGR